MTPLHVPFWRHGLTEADRAAWMEVARSPHLTTGPRTAELERRLSQILGLGDAVATTSCTTALHLALLAMGVDPGDEVVTTPMSFVATANADLHTGATPVFADVQSETGLLDPVAAEAAITPKTRVLLPVHLYGAMADMEALCAIAERHGLSILEDAAHALSSKGPLGPPGTGTAGACFSFYATKPATAGEGGAFATGDPALAERVRRLRLHGLDHSPAQRGDGPYRHYEMTDLGWKANMSDLSAVLLLGQLEEERMAPRIAARKALHAAYDKGLEGIPGISLPPPLPASCAPYLYTLRVPSAVRDAFLKGLEGRGIGIAVNYRPIHLMPHYRCALGLGEGGFPHAEAIGAETLTLPSQGLSDEEVERVCAAVGETALELR